MEILLILQPAALGFGLLIGSMGIIGFLLATLTICVEVERKEQYMYWKKYKKYMVIWLSSMFLLIGCACSWDSYKNLLIYKSINSDTTAKSIQILETLLDKVEERIK